jgi:phosphoribosylformylglycinamidine synthase
VLHYYRSVKDGFEYCYYINISGKLTESENCILRWLLAETFEPERFSKKSMLGGKNVIELGPRLNFETSYSTNAVAICNSCGIKKILRLERSRRYTVPDNADIGEFIKAGHDRMTECLYSKPLESFETGIIPEKVYEIPLIEDGASALREINKKMGLGLDKWDIGFYYDLFINKIGRNPTNVECFQLSQANSEHSRHWFFKGRLIIDGNEISGTLIQIIRGPLDVNPSNSLIAFKDNSSAIVGYDVDTIIPSKPGFCSLFNEEKTAYHIIFTAETHNFPSGIAPFPGAETGTGGRIRDVEATGRGGLVVAGTAGYCTGNLNMDGYKIPGEDESFIYPTNMAAPLDIMIEESNGASDYGNKFGEPVIGGFTRTFGQNVAGMERREWIKPIMFSGGLGQMDSRHTEKYKPEKGMLIIQIGGPAYRIGIGGGSASSLIQDEEREELDFNAVQRGNAQMEQKLNRVIRACIEMGNLNPILSIHDQGAGGPCNVLTEIVEPAGGRIEIRNIQTGDRTMSVLEIWGAEYQERNALLIRKDSLDILESICRREKVNLENLGEITGDGRIKVHDKSDGSTPVDLDLGDILSNIPQKTFRLESRKKDLKRLIIPEGLSVEEALKLVFRLPSVGSKGFLVRKVDRSVTGLVARQQCCGPLQLPVSDFSVIAQSHFGYTGAAVSIGEQPLKIMIDAAAGARMSVAEALTNMVWVVISRLEDIKCSVNWMWPAKLPGEGAELYKAASAISSIMKEIGIAADGGKDSISMAARVKGETVKAPNEVVISAYASVPDVRKAVTPDIKKPGQSRLAVIDLSGGRARLGGSALAQALAQTGDICPDIEDARKLASAFRVMQELISEGIILSGHDISDGGLITTLSEMAMAGNCGMDINLPSLKCGAIEQLFSEEAGFVIEYLPRDEQRIIDEFSIYNIIPVPAGKTSKIKQVKIEIGGRKCLDIKTGRLLCWWEETADMLETKQMNPSLAAEQAGSHERRGPRYRLTFQPMELPKKIINNASRPAVAVIREEGSNGDREMASAFYMAGFEVWDVTMTDLLSGEADLKNFRGAAFVGGFSYADVMDSAKGWAGTIKFNSGLRKMFEDFYLRTDTFSLGVCNGCQLMALLGWVPWQGIEETVQPRFTANPSGRFESRWASVKINRSPSIMLKGMEGSQLGIWIDHGEGYFNCPDSSILECIKKEKLAPLVFIDDDGRPTERYPYNPNSSPEGITALCSRDGRHLAMMPHPERAFLTWQWPWMPLDWREELEYSPWVKLFQNARIWCEEVG